MQCGRVGGCLLYFRSSESNDFGDLFLFRRVWHPAIPTPPPMVSVCVGIARYYTPYGSCLHGYSKMRYPPMVRGSVGIAGCYTLLWFVFACKVKTQLTRAALGFAACQSKKAQHHIAQGSALGIECIY